MVIVLFNAFSGHFLSMTSLGELHPALGENLHPLVAQRSIMWAIAFSCGVAGIAQALMSLLTVMLKLGMTKFLLDAAPGVMPIFQWGACASFMWSHTAFAWVHPALAMLILMPGFCLINSKMIVCNFTKMEVQEYAVNFIVILLIPFNLRFCK